jgi:hypothetical protein
MHPSGRGAAEESVGLKLMIETYYDRGIESYRSSLATGDGLAGRSLLLCGGIAFDAAGIRYNSLFKIMA